MPCCDAGIELELVVELELRIRTTAEFEFDDEFEFDSGLNPDQRTTMKPTIRPFAPEDYPAICAIGNAVYPEYPGTPEEVRFNDERRDPKCRRARWVAEQDGALIGVGRYGQSSGHYHPRKFWLELSVVPDRQGHGIGRALYEHVMAAIAPFDPLTVRSGVREDMTRGLRFLQDRGFEEEMRAWESRLDAETFDPSPYEGHDEKVRAGGIEIRTLQELASDPRRNEKLWELQWLLDQDVPAPDLPTQVPFDVFVKDLLESPGILPDAFFVALDGDRYVGESVLNRSLANDDLYTGLTGVRREYRRRGIALALKLRAIAWAKANGRRVIKTWNERNNRPMLSINERLGFVKQPAWIDFAKQLRTT